MLTYHTLCDKKKSKPAKTRYCSSFPVPSHWVSSPSCSHLGSFFAQDDNNWSFIVDVCFYDGTYFFVRQDEDIDLLITSCSFTSLRNCLAGLKATSKTLQWHVDPKYFLCDSYKLPPIKEDFHEF